MFVETFKVMANVAQLVEPRFVVPVVVGSSPIVRPRLCPDFMSGLFFLRTIGLFLLDKTFNILACKYFV